MEVIECGILWRLCSSAMAIMLKLLSICLLLSVTVVIQNEYDIER